MPTAPLRHGEVWQGALDVLTENLTRLDAKTPSLNPLMAEEFFAFAKKMGWEHSEEQERILRSNSRFQVVEAGRRSGKTEIAIRKATAQMVLRAGSQVGYAVRHLKTLERNWPRFANEVEHAASLGFCRVTRRSDTMKEIGISNHSSLTGGSMDNPYAWVGTGYDLLIGDEAGLFEPWAWTEVFENAISDRRGHAFLVSTPYGPTWLSEMPREERRALRREARLSGMSDAGEIARYAEERCAWEMFNFSSWSNRFVYPGGENDPEIQRLRRVLSPEDYLQQVVGIPKPPVDRVYGEFDEDVHTGVFKVQPKRPDRLGDTPRPIMLGVDPSLMGANPYAVIAVQDFGDYVVCVDEYYEKGVLAEDVLRDLRARPWWPQVELIVFDDAHPSETTKWRTLLEENERIDCVKAKKGEAKDGIALVRSWMRNPILYNEVTKQHRVAVFDELRESLGDEPMSKDDYHAAEVMVRQRLSVRDLQLCAKVYVDYSCSNMIKEFRKYRTKERRNKDLNPVEAPMDAWDHLLDAFRYVMWYTKRRWGN